MPNPPTAIRANEAPPRAKSSHLPAPFSSMMTDRVKRPLGDIFGLASFGVNHVRLPAGPCQHFITGTVCRTNLSLWFLAPSH